MSISKEKRTKEQVLRLLDRAIEQEEILLENVKTLEAELADCRKKAENPRHDLEEHAQPGSKVSFRLDYYRTEKKGTYKGIIEHLSSRESCSFEANRFEEVGDFVAKFVSIDTPKHRPSKQPTEAKTHPSFPPEIIENTIEPEQSERSPLLKKLFPEFFGAPTPGPKKPVIAEPPPIPVKLEAEPFLVLTEGKHSHQRAVHRGQAIQIQIPMRSLDAFQGKPCSLILSAKSLERKPAPPIEAIEDCTPSQDTLLMPARMFPFKEGVYRLVVSMTRRDEPKNAIYRDDRILIVQ